MPSEPPRLERLAELTDAQLSELGLTRAGAATMDRVVGMMMSTVMTLYGNAFGLLAESVERFIEVIQGVHHHVLATVAVLSEKDLIKPGDAERLRQILAELRAGRAIDAVFEPAIGREVRDTLNKLKDWIRRFEEKNRT